MLLMIHYNMNVKIFTSPDNRFYNINTLKIVVKTTPCSFYIKMASTLRHTVNRLFSLFDEIRLKSQYIFMM